MTQLNALHVHEVEPPQPPGSWWEEHSTSVITIGVMVAITGLAWAVWANWEVVQETILSTFR